ncbi:Dihydrolipoyl dehydrogenase [Diplonema papillatum]|nr:Dihydrolipoyl dehydrogenase [Diplonema papillatum]
MSQESCEAAALEVVKQVLSGKTPIGDILGPLHAGPSTMAMNPCITVPPGDKRPVATASTAPVAPMDEFNKELVRETGPHTTRQNPTPKAEYDLVVIGAGVAGLLSSIMAKSLGKRVAMVERHYMGGDCLNVGCFPSKALIACAKRVHQIKTAGDFGVEIGGPIAVNFPFIMERMRKLRASIAPHDGVARYERDFNEHIFLGQAKFAGNKAIEVIAQDGSVSVLHFKKAMIATGGSAFVPPIRGIQTAPCLTNNTFFNLESLPPRLALIGAGPIGIEMAQTMARLGCKVTILETFHQILRREDPDAACVLQDSFIQHEENLSLKLGVSIESISMVAADGREISSTSLPLTAPVDDGAWDAYTITLKHSDGSVESIAVDAVLNATGRVPNVTDLGLDIVGVDYDTSSGVHTDDFFKTTNEDIYACGDVASPFKFTHAADWHARTAIRNMFLGLTESKDNVLVPWCTYTDPEIAHVGKYESELSLSGVEFVTYKRNFKDVDRCKCDGITDGFVKLTCLKGSDKIIGCTIVGPNAGDLISEVTVAITNNMGLSKLAGTIHPYPTTAEAIRQCAAIYWQAGNLKTPVNQQVVTLLLEQKGLGKSNL